MSHDEGGYDEGAICDKAAKCRGKDGVRRNRSLGMPYIGGGRHGGMSEMSEMSAGTVCGAFPNEGRVFRECAERSFRRVRDGVVWVG